jgi:hypothetical protein
MQRHALHLFGHHHLDELFVVDFAVAINISFHESFHRLPRP